MTDRELLLERLERLAIVLGELMPQGAELVRDAIALLKEQEAVDPEVEVLNEIERLYKCPKCHKHFFYRRQKYCDQCGQAVKWNEID